MRNPRLPALVVLLPLLAALVGCGGGGGDSSEASQPTTEATPTLSKEAFISQGDAICAEVNAAVGSVGASTSESGAQTQITQVASLYAGMVESLKGLGEPDEKAGYAEFIEAADEFEKVEGEIKLDAEREDTAALGEAATRATPVLEEFQAAATAYGFQKCGEGPTAPTSTAPGSTGGEAEEAPSEATPEVVEEATPEEVEEVAPETGGAGSAPEEAAPEGGGTGAGGGEGETGGSSGGIGPG